MQPTNVMLQPNQVATVFENIFVYNWDIRPSTLNLATCTPNNAGMDSLDTMETLITLENKFGIKISNEEGYALMHAPLGNMLNICTKKLVENNRLTASDAKIVMTNYAKLVKQNVAKINQKQK